MKLKNIVLSLCLIIYFSCQLEEELEEERSDDEEVAVQAIVIEENKSVQETEVDPGRRRLVFDAEEGADFLASHVNEEFSSQFKMALSTFHQAESSCAGIFLRQKGEQIREA